MQLWCGIDWAENHHDVSVVDGEGRQRVRLRIGDTAAGFSELMSMLAEQQELCERPISVAIETAKGLLPAALRAGGVALVAINPLAVSRYRDRLSPSRAKSDAGDAFVLANILRTDPHNHRRLPVDSELAQAIQVLARAHQDAVWDRMQIANKLRSTLREFYPTFLAAFDDLASREARATLHLAPTPGAGQQVPAGERDGCVAPRWTQSRHPGHGRSHPRRAAPRPTPPTEPGRDRDGRARHRAAARPGHRRGQRDPTRGAAADRVRTTP